MSIVRRLDVLDVSKLLASTAKLIVVNWLPIWAMQSY